MAEVEPQFRAKGVSLLVVGNGNVAQARAFAESRNLPFPLYTDPSLSTYEAAGMRKAMMPGVATARTTARALSHGHVQTATQGDPWQQGGAHLIFPGPTVRWSYVSRVAGDHFEPEDALAAI